MADKKKKRGFTPNVTVGGSSISMAEIRDMAEADPRGFMQKTQKVIDDGKLSWRDIGDLKALFHALADVQVEAEVNILGQKRAITASAFPMLSGNLTVAAINEAYEGVPVIGDQLVTEFEDNKRSTSFASILTEDVQKDRVDEAEPFPEVKAGEERYEIRHKRNGRRMAITAETIEENDTAQIVDKCNALGIIAAETIEELTLDRVMDLNGSGSSPAEPYVYRPSGVGTQLYTTTANNPGTRAPSGTRVNNNALVDGSDLSAARTVLKAMLNPRGKRINMPMSQAILLVPDALDEEAFKILNSKDEPGIVNEKNAWGPEGRYRPKQLSSSYLDVRSTTAWYLGFFPKQFKRKWKLRFEYVTLEGNTQKFLESRIAFQARIAWDCEIGAVDYVWVVQNLAVSTEPS